jgi:transcriptional regulator with XRE-family HTH domain
VPDRRRQKVTPRSARLGGELRALRTLADMSQQDVADAMSKKGDPGAIKISKTTVGRAETGAQWLSRAQVERWAQVTGASPEAARRVVALTEALHGATWSDALASEPVRHLQGVAARRDAASKLTRMYDQNVIPGLLQTVEYAHAVIPIMDPTGEIDHAAAEAARVDRRDILFRDQGHRFEFIIGQPALEWSPAPGVLPGQLRRVAELAELPTVRVAVLPTRRDGTPNWQGFVYREPADGSSAYVTQELIHGGPVYDEPDVLDLFREQWGQLWAAALHGDDALALIREAATPT